MSQKKIAFLFPGQGSQYPGIGKDLFDEFQIAKDTYAEASDTLGYDIAKLSFEDPNGEINLTRYTQPVLLTHSTTCQRLFNSLTGNSVKAGMAAGHSLGEYSALVCANALTFSAGLQLVKTRGELMGEHGNGEMEALMIDLSSAQSLAEQHNCGLAACNLPDQNVVGGLAEDLDALVVSMAEQFPRKRSARLKTEGAFHTFYMSEAAERFKDVLAEAEFSIPDIDVLSNYSGDTHEGDSKNIKDRLHLQLINPVLWHANLLRTGDVGVELFIEFGGGLGKGETPAEKRPNLESIVKKTFRGVELAPEYLSVINLETLKETVGYFQA